MPILARLPVHILRFVRFFWCSLFFQVLKLFFLLQDPKGARHAGDLGNVVAEGGVAKVSSTVFSKPNSLSTSVADQ
jgi:hypothetical protein